MSQDRLQPMSNGKRHFIVGSFLCYSYKLILISPGIFHRALFEKWLTLVAEKSPESAKFTYSNLEAFNVHPPSYVHPALKREDRLGKDPFAGFGTVVEDITGSGYTKNQPILLGAFWENAFFVFLHNKIKQKTSQNTPKSDFRGPKIPPRGATSTWNM